MYDETFKKKMVRLRMEGRTINSIIQRNTTYLNLLSHVGVRTTAKNARIIQKPRKILMQWRKSAVSGKNWRRLVRKIFF